MAEVVLKIVRKPHFVGRVQAVYVLDQISFDDCHIFKTLGPRLTVIPVFDIFLAARRKFF